MNKEKSVDAVSSMPWLAALVELRRNADANIARHQKEKPNDKQGFATRSARRNGIQDCINETLRGRALKKVMTFNKL